MVHTSCRVVLFGCTRPGGKLPRWAVRRVAAEAPAVWAPRLREACSVLMRERGIDDVKLEFSTSTMLKLKKLFEEVSEGDGSTTESSALRVGCAALVGHSDDILV